MLADRLSFCASAEWTDRRTDEEGAADLARGRALAICMYFLSAMNVRCVAGGVACLAQLDYAPTHIRCL
jgi:hypothetical protein